MAGDAETGVSIMRLTAGLDSGPVCLQEREPIRPDDDYGTLSARLRELGGALLARALDERPPFAEQDEAGVTYADKIEAADRVARPDPAARRRSERVVRALRPHIGARLPLPGRLVPRRPRGRGRRRDARARRRPRAHRRRAPAARLQRRRARAARGPAARRPPDGRRGLAARAARPGARQLLARPAPARALARGAGRARASASGDSDAEWPPYMAALAWRGDEAVLAARARALAPRRPAGARRRGLRAGPARRARADLPAESAAALEELERARGRPGGAGRDRAARSATSARRTGSRRCCACAAIPTRASARARPTRSPGRDDERVFDALVELTSDPEPGIRDWATFALGTLSPQDTPVLRDALAARLDDSDDDTRIEAVHGLALRGDTRALDAVLDLLGEVGPHDDGGNAADTIWKRYALTQATVRLAALTGDARLKQHLPALDERLVGTSHRAGPPARLRARHGGRLVREAGAVAALVAMAPAVAVGRRRRPGSAASEPASRARRRVRRPQRVRSGCGAGAARRARPGSAWAPAARACAAGRAPAPGSGRRARRPGRVAAGSAPVPRAADRPAPGSSGSGGGRGGRDRDVVPGIVGMLGGRRVGDVADRRRPRCPGRPRSRPASARARRRRADVLARAGVGPGLLLGEVDGAVAVGVVLGVVDAVAVGVGLPRVRGRRELDAVAQAVAVRVLVAVADAVAVGVGPVGLRADPQLGQVVEAVAVGVLRGVGGVVGIEAVAALPGVGQAVAVGVAGRGRQRGVRRGLLVRSVDGARRRRGARSGRATRRRRGARPRRGARRSA